MKKVPCVRDLKMFRRSGCPQKEWDGEEGCPMWKEMSVGTRENPQKKEVRKQCIDVWQFDFSWAMLGLLEGNQQAIETFRNGMIYQDESGNLQPKPDPTTLALAHVINVASENRIPKLEEK